MRFIETWSPATLVSTRDLAPGIREFLIRPDQFDGAAYPVGSHINISVTIDGQPETRSYSLVEASSRGLRIAVRRAEDSRGGSRYMWSLQPGARLDITTPASLLAVDWARQNYCLIAGGIGITPILGAAQALSRRGADVTLHYAVRSRTEAAYLDDLAATLGDRLVVHASDEGKRLDLDALFASRCPRMRWRCSAARCGCWMLRAMPGSAPAIHSPISATRRSVRAARCRPRLFACA